MNGLSVGACLFEMVIWVDCFVLLERDFVGKMVGLDVVMEVVVEVVVGEAVDVVRADFFFFLRRGCLGKMMGARVVIEVVIEVVVLVWWRWSVVWGLVGELVVQAIGEMVWQVAEEMLAWLVEELDGRIVADSLMILLESSGQTSHTVSHSRSIGG